MQVVVRADDKQTMGEAVMVCLHHARNTRADFSFGPLLQAQIMKSGLELTGDIEAVVKDLREVRGVTVEEVQA